MKFFRRQRAILQRYRTEQQWFVERDGVRVAYLRAPEFVEMFWMSYEVVPLSNDPAERARVLSPDFWNLELLANTQFVSGVFGHTAAAFWSHFESGRLTMRGLYHGVPASWWDRTVMSWLIRFGY
jgi:hypothetical protein